MIRSWDTFTTRNVHKEGGLMTKTFLNSWVWFTCISLMVNISDRKRRFMLYIFIYFHDALMPIITAVTFENILRRNTSVCREPCDNWRSWCLCTNYESIHTQCDGSRLLGYCFYKYATNMVGVNEGLIFLANISRKYTKYKTWGSHSRSSFKLNTKFDFHTK